VKEGPIHEFLRNGLALSVFGIVLFGLIQSQFAIISLPLASVALVLFIVLFEDITMPKHATSPSRSLLWLAVFWISFLAILGFAISIGFPEYFS
jgi:hypothetical protein